MFDGRKYTSFASYKNNWERTLTVYSAGKLMNCTGWKVGWVIGPEEPLTEACLIHEASIFNVNTTGQVAIGWSLDQMLDPYKGAENFRTYVKNTFEQSEHDMINTFIQSDLPVTPFGIDGGYFTMMDVSAAASMIPEKYFQAGNYEEDPNTLVFQKKFEGRVPVDYAFSRWLAIERGVTVMPGSPFFSDEHKDHSLVRVAICKTPDVVEEVRSRLLGKGAVRG